MSRLSKSMVNDKWSYPRLSRRMIINNERKLVKGGFYIDPNHPDIMYKITYINKNAKDKYEDYSRWIRLKPYYRGTGKPVERFNLYRFAFSSSPDELFIHNFKRIKR